MATHELFKHLNYQSREKIEDGKYVLILDEVLSVVEPYDGVTLGDMQLLKDSGWVTIDEEGFLIWNKEKIDYDTKYDEMKYLADNRGLMYVNEKILVWRYPPDIFALFEEVYILTYMFNASILKYYFDMHDIRYDKKSLANIEGQYQMVEFFKPDVSCYKEKIHIYQGRMNENFSQKASGLSKAWFKSTTNRDNYNQIKNNIYNYFSRIQKAKSETIMWSTFKDARNKLKGKGYSNSFIACNCRSTNEYMDRYNLAYCVNLYLHPGVKQYFAKKDIVVDQDLYALSEMIQWIWRSRIRKGEEVYIYIPSTRMRKLIMDWLDLKM